MKRIVLAAALFLSFCGAAYAQPSVSLYCWNPSGSNATNNQFTPCSAANPLVVSATFTPSGTQNVNITQILGAAPSATNPLWIQPGTGAAFALAAGSALVGKVGIDQTTDGTTNGVRATNQYPSGATPITASATGTTGATTATLATGSSLTTYICGFSIRANATGAATGNATVTGTITGTLNFTQWTAPLASGLGITEMIFTPCVPASATNTSIAVVSAAPGSGGVVSSTAWGYTK